MDNDSKALIPPGVDLIEIDNLFGEIKIMDFKIRIHNDKSYKQKSKSGMCVWLERLFTSFFLWIANLDLNKQKFMYILDLATQELYLDLIVKMESTINENEKELLSVLQSNYGKKA